MKGIRDPTYESQTKIIQPVLHGGNESKLGKKRKLGEGQAKQKKEKKKKKKKKKKSRRRRRRKEEEEEEEEEEENKLTAHNSRRGESTGERRHMNKERRKKCLARTEAENEEIRLPRLLDAWRVAGCATGNVRPAAARPPRPRTSWERAHNGEMWRKLCREPSTWPLRGMAGRPDAILLFSPWRAARASRWPPPPPASWRVVEKK